MILTGSRAFLSVARTGPVSDMILLVEGSHVREKSATPDEDFARLGLCANHSTTPLTVHVEAQTTRSELCFTL
ncbi:hypothetical protein Q1M63_01615 (plasmid) [Sinorhizobium meliloti]|nr:hypothetical protein Q1M63_01615 [Sinorhizobium meliloti]